MTPKFKVGDRVRIKDIHLFETIVWQIESIDIYAPYPYELLWITVLPGLKINPHFMYAKENVLEPAT